MSRIPIFESASALPPRLGVLSLANVEVYSDVRAGAAFRYRGVAIQDRPPPHGHKELAVITELLCGPKFDFSHVKADAYLYTLGLQEIPADFESEVMAEIYHHALDEIFAVVDNGGYQHFEILMQQFLKIPLHMPKSNWLCTTMRYRQREAAGTSYDQDRISHLALRTDAGYINKVRYTYPAELPASLAYGDFLLFLFDWQRSINRILAGEESLPSEGDLSDEEWVKTLQAFRHSPLPHPLGFFDRAQAEVRQAKLVADHLHSSIGPERPLENHEIRNNLHHEISHSIFSILEREMAITVDFGGIGSFIDQRPSEERNGVPNDT
jgi:hypothetical protein